jgi:CRP/FNR family transcriptional regulator, cyclic AMP receptor protein
VLVVRNFQSSNLVRLLPTGASPVPALGTGQPRYGPHLRRPRLEIDSKPELSLHPEARDPLYLIACHAQWENRSEPTAAWELISAAQSSHADTRAHARDLLEHSLRKTEQLRAAPSPKQIPVARESGPNLRLEARMKAPNGLDIIESCIGCKASRSGFFCRFSPQALRSLDDVSHHTVMPATAVLFVEGQTPRGVFILCSGTVKLSTTSKDGKVLVLKQASPGDVLGLSAALSGTSYEVTAEAETACQLNFIGRQDLMMLLHNESEMGVHSALWLSREFQGAYRDIHDLVLARSSSGKLARLLLSSCAPSHLQGSGELLVKATMTHEEMAQRIGTSRETVTRWLTELKKKSLIRSVGDTLIIRDRAGLEALTV